MEAIGTPDFNSQDLYKNLGVPRDASNAIIKKAYKKLSLKHHPDKNPNNKEQAEEIFKKISYAYGILGDAKKRQDYDQYGREFFEQGGSSGGGGRGGPQFREFRSSNFNMRNADDIFKEFFGGRDPFAGFFDDDDDFFGDSGFGRGGLGGGMMGGSLFDRMDARMGGQGFARQQTQQPGGGQRQQQQQAARRRDPFAGFGMMMDDDDFFGGGFGGGGGGFTSFQSSSFGGFGGGGMGESIQQSTVIENGRQKTVTKKTKTDANGNRTTEVIEEFEDPNTGELYQNKYIQNGQSSSSGQQRKAIGGAARSKTSKYR